MFKFKSRGNCITELVWDGTGEISIELLLLFLYEPTSNCSLNIKERTFLINNRTVLPAVHLNGQYCNSAERSGNLLEWILPSWSGLPCNNYTFAQMLGSFLVYTWHLMTQSRGEQYSEVCLRRILMFPERSRGKVWDSRETNFTVPQGTSH